MIVSKRIFESIAVLVVLSVGISPAFAQATRTWVSGVGDDANPGSRTAPCKTFAGAIAKTAVGGEINVLDPGGFGAVTITKSISICSATGEGGVLVGGTDGIVINTSNPTDVVVLRGLDIEGAGTGLNGINFTGQGALFVERCTIERFTQHGIAFTPNAASQLFVTDTIIRNNTGVGSGGILLKPSAGTVKASLAKVRMENNLFGIRVEDNSKASAWDCVSAGNANNGFLCVSNTAAAELNLVGCMAVNTGLNGIATSGAAATIRINACNILDNGTGLNSALGGQILSYGTNAIDGNGVDGNPTGGPPRGLH